VESDIDDLFQLPLAEFTAARNALAARLKKSGQIDEASRVKAMSKPPVSAWTVNQLYWQHREAFDTLMRAGEQVVKTHASQLAGKAADTRAPLAARREALATLSRLAETLLRDSGHNPAPDTIRRIATTLEALSSHASMPNPPHLGRLSEDLDPPGFESFAGLVPGTPKMKAPASAPARASLEAAERVLQETRARANELAKTLQRATAQANEADEQLANARTAAQEARERLKTVRAEAEKVAVTLKAAERDVETARNILKTDGR